MICLYSSPSRHFLRWSWVLWNVLLLLLHVLIAITMTIWAIRLNHMGINHKKKNTSGEDLVWWLPARRQSLALSYRPHTWCLSHISGGQHSPLGTCASVQAWSHRHEKQHWKTTKQQGNNSQHTTPTRCQPWRRSMCCWSLHSPPVSLGGFRRWYQTPAEHLQKGPLKTDRQPSDRRTGGSGCAAAAKMK